jgi:hypothetical protein
LFDAHDTPALRQSGAFGTSEKGFVKLGGVHCGGVTGGSGSVAITTMTGMGSPLLAVPFLTTSSNLLPVQVTVVVPAGSAKKFGTAVPAMFLATHDAASARS